MNNKFSMVKMQHDLVCFLFINPESWSSHCVVGSKFNIIVWKKIRFWHFLIVSPKLFNTYGLINDNNNYWI